MRKKRIQINVHAVALGGIESFPLAKVKMFKYILYFTKTAARFIEYIEQ